MYAVAPGKVSFGSPADVAENGGIVVVEAAGRTFGYWHVAPAIHPGVHVPLHGLLGHIATQPEDWGHVHLAESTHDPEGITYWNPLRPGALAPFIDRGPPVIDAILTSLPPQSLHGLADLSVKAHDTTPIPVTQPNPPGWRGLPVTPACIRWRLTRAGPPVVPWQVAFDHRTSLHPDIHGNPPTDANFAPSTHPTPQRTTGTHPASTTSGSSATSTPAGTPTAPTRSKSKPATPVATRPPASSRSASSTRSAGSVL